MLCRRRLYRLRTRGKLAVVFFVIFLGLVLTYWTLNDHDGQSDSSSSFPTMDFRRPFRFRPRDGFNARDKAILLGTAGSVRNGLSRQSVQEVLTLLFPLDWKSAREPDEVAIVLKDHMLELNLLSPMTCREIDALQIGGSMGSSPKKFVERLQEPDLDTYGYGQERRGRARKLMVVKSQANDVQTKIACMKQIYNADFCSPMGNYLLMREVFFLSLLQHPGLIRVLGYCLRGDHISLDMQKKGLLLVMEAGVPLTGEIISTLSWARRIRLALDAVSLMAFLQSSPLGSLGFPRLQMKDFVLVDHKTLKLTDLDEVVLEDRPCKTSSNCLMQGSEVGVECYKGRCKGLNQRTNLWVFGRMVVTPLIQEAPPPERKAVGEVLDRVRRLDIQVGELISFLESLADKYELHEDSDIANLPGYNALKDKQNKHLDMRQEEDRDEDEDEDEDDDEEDENLQNNIVEARGKKVRGDHPLDEDEKGNEGGEPSNPQPDKYKRLDSSNFPGMYDYSCSDSRVLWGCVMTFHSLSAAMDHCSLDAQCQAFAIFSPNPENENRMTVVFKDRSSAEPHINLGVTLFLKKEGGDTKQEEPISRERVEEGGARDREGEGQKESKKSKAEQVLERQECVNRNHQNQEDALRSRERRIMAHMGLKGMQEKDWKRAVRMQAITGFSAVRPLTGQGSHGGSMILQYNTSTVGHKISRAKFMVEEGEHQNHVAFALIYHLDRLLGLYHTPPCTEGFIPSSLVSTFTANATWQSAFGSMTSSDGTLRGLFVAPTPKVVKKSKLLLMPLNEMPSRVLPFDRTQKLQLEYVLLWWLGHIGKPNDLHRGFKGHLIHVDADQGFQDPANEFVKYLNHCQFPNVVYKVLSCFRCGGAPPNKICSLGQEVVRRLEATGLKVADLHVKDLTERDYLLLINGAASRILETVDKCVHTFGREAVLY